MSHKLNDVPESTRKSLAELRKRGIKTVIATGRHMIELSKLPVMQGLEFDGYLTLNGQLCLDKTMHVVAGNPIDAGEMEILISIFHAKRIPFMLIGQDDRYINMINPTVIKTQAATKGTVSNIGAYKGEKIYQAIAFVPDNQRQLLDSILDECQLPPGTLLASISSHGVVENLKAYRSFWMRKESAAAKLWHSVMERTIWTCLSLLESV